MLTLQQPKPKIMFPRQFSLLPPRHWLHNKGISRLWKIGGMFMLSLVGLRRPTGLNLSDYHPDLRCNKPLLAAPWITGKSVKRNETTRWSQWGRARRHTQGPPGASCCSCCWCCSTWSYNCRWSSHYYWSCSSLCCSCCSLSAPLDPPTAPLAASRAPLAGPSTPNASRAPSAGLALSDSPPAPCAPVVLHPASVQPPAGGHQSHAARRKCWRAAAAAASSLTRQHLMVTVCYF